MAQPYEVMNSNAAWTFAFLLGVFLAEFLPGSADGIEPEFILSLYIWQYRYLNIFYFSEMDCVRVLVYLLAAPVLPRERI